MKLSVDDVTIRPQARQSLALRVTPIGDHTPIEGGIRVGPRVSRHGLTFDV